jgi:hypothetical protein
VTVSDALSELVAEVEARRRELVVYAPEGADPELAATFETRNVTVSRRSLPAGGPPGFVVIRDADDAFAGAVGLSALREFLSPPISPPWDADSRAGYRELFAAVEEALFVAADRRQLLATSREIEDRAWRAGRGTLRVAFQSRTAFELQLAVYRRLVADTDLDVHLYGSPDWIRAAPRIEDVTFHDAPDDLAVYWVLAFDGGDDPENACALVAEELLADDYRGFWTYDRDTVERVDDALGRVDT